MKQPKPNVLIFDIETSYDILAAYGLAEQYHSPNNILQHWFMICFCWKWLDGSRIYNCSIADDIKRYKKDPHDDFLVVKRLHEVLAEADCIVGHNVASFDWKKFMARAIYHKLPPLKKPVIIDTLKEARKMAKFTSNKLSFLAEHLGLEKKLLHPSDMWLRILKGDTKAVKDAVVYCRGDISTTEALYKRLAPYMQTTPLNMGMWRADGIDACPHCGSEHIVKDGFKYTRAGKYQAYRCRDCAGWMQGKNNLRTVKLK